MFSCKRLQSAILLILSAQASPAQVPSRSSANSEVRQSATASRSRSAARVGRPAPADQIFAVFGYRDLPGAREIDLGLGRALCWSALGAKSETEARLSAARFGIQFADLSSYHRDGFAVLALTDGYSIYWDVSLGNPFYDLMPLSVEVAWQRSFDIRRQLTGRHFSAVIFFHELGHRLRGLPPDLTSEVQNRANTTTVILSCLPELREPTMVRVRQR